MIKLAVRIAMTSRDGAAAFISNARIVDKEYVMSDIAAAIDGKKNKEE